MSSIPTLSTARLTLRPLRDDDLEAFHRVLGEPDVLRYFPRPEPPSVERVREIIAGQHRHWAERGYGWWGVSPKGSDAFMGWCGLQYLPDTDEVEVGCLLAPAHWGKGFAIEGGMASLEFGFRVLGAGTIVAIVHPENKRSRRAVEMMGFAFTHEAVYFGMDARRYAIDREAFLARLRVDSPARAEAPPFRPLETERLILRRLVPEDAEPMFRYRSDPEVSRYQGWAPGDISVIAAFIAEQAAIAPGAPGTWLQLGITGRETGELLGDCGIRFPAGQPHEVELGITLAPQHQGRGYAREALRAVFQYVFETLGKRRIYGSVDPRNARSLMLLERAGLRREAHHRESLWFKGAWADDVIYALLASEWRSAGPVPDARSGK